MSTPLLSLIIPAHNEERRLPAALEEICDFLAKQNYQAEVLIVENGSQDRTFEIAQQFADNHPEFIAIHEDGRGKGLAVRRGMLAARGEFRFMCDADLSMPVDEINLFLPPLSGEFDLAIASREAPGSVRYNEPGYRHVGGRLINLVIRMMILPGLQDTQCGFKCFRAAAAIDLFSRQTLLGWSFDIEILYLARKLGYSIAEIPIQWYFDPESKLRAYSDAFKMVRDILRIHRNNIQGRYARSQDGKA